MHFKKRTIPFLKGASLPLALSTVLVFWSPVNENSWINAAFLFGMILAYYLSITAYCTPYNALIPELGHTQQERLNISTIISFTFIAGTAVAYLAPAIWGTLIPSSGRVNAIRITFTAMAAAAFVCMLVPVFCIREKDYVDTVPSKDSAFRSLTATFRNGEFRKFVGSDIFYWIALTMFQTGLPFFVTSLLKLPETMTTLYFVGMTALSLVFYVPVNKLTPKLGKKKMILFAIPLFLGNLFQQLYNTADSLIVGNFLGSNALAAVSSSGNLIFLMVGFINGIAMGAGVVIARYYGAKNREDLQKAIHTTVAFGLAAGAALTVLGMYLAPKILVLMGTPSDVLPQSVEYFRTYFAGSLGFIMYNIFVGILQSVGDSRHPLIYLIVSSCINVVLDLLFIGGLGMGVGAAALATVISQFTSAILCMIHLLRTKEEYRLHIRKIRFDGRALGEIIRNGVPSGFQNSVISIANVFVQTNINAFGKMAMAGCGSYAKIEGFAFLPVTCFTMALTTFVSQNLGAKQYDRAKKGARFGILCSITIAELIGFVIYAAAPTLIAAFNSDPAVVHYGVMQARTIALFYFLLAFSHCIAAVLRGSGHAAVPMVVMLCVWCLFRVSYITVTVRLIPDIRVIFWAYPLTWSISSVIFLYLFLKGKWVYGFEKGGKQR